MKLNLTTPIQSLLIAICISGGLANAQTFTNYTTADGLASNNVLAVAVDSSDRIWFGTQAGVSVFDGLTWTTHSTATDTGFVDNNISCIAVMTNQDIWVGSDFGVSFYNGSFWTTYKESDGLGDNRVNYITEDPNGNIWFGDYDGVTKYDGSTWTSYNMSNGLPFGGINYVTAFQNDIWLSTPFSGFYHFDGTTFTAYTENNGLLSNAVRAIAVDAQNNKWVGSTDGISVFNSGNMWTNDHELMLLLPPPDSLNPVEDIKINSQGIVWTGIYVDYLVTEGGVAWFNGSQWIAYDVSDGLIGPVVRRIAIDSNDDVWVATSTGVTKISNVPTAIGESAQNSANLLFPNPVNDHFYLNILIQDNKNSEPLLVYNIAGQLQLSVDRPTSNMQVDCSGLNTGMYILRYANSAQKFIVR